MFESHSLPDERVGRRCLAVYVPAASLLMYALFFRTPIDFALAVMLVTVSLSALLTSLIVLPFFRSGHCEPLRKQQVVFTAVGFAVLAVVFAVMALAWRT